MREGMEKRTLLVEVGTEELPVHEQARAQEYVRRSFRRFLDEHGLEYNRVFCWVTPHRITLYVEELESQFPSRKLEIKGPPASVAYTDDGKPTKALEGFLRSNDAQPEDVFLKETNKGVYVFIHKEEPPRHVMDELPDILTHIFTHIPFSKRMRWPQSPQPFSRPVRWICALFGDEVLSWECFGLKAGRETWSGWSCYPRYTLTLKHAEEYISKLHEAMCIPDQDERYNRFEKILHEEVERLETELGCPVHLQKDEELLQFWVGIIEWPRVLRGNFSEEFLDIPHVILVTAMRHHQKYFPVFHDRGKLAPFFMTPLHTLTQHIEPIRRTHERVLTARFRDAQFFWEEDRKRGLESYAQELEQIQWIDRGGTYADKVARMGRLVQELPFGLTERDHKILKDAIRLYRADLATQLVGEFPELEGITGALLAHEEGKPKELIQAIEESRYPETADDPIPQSRIGHILVLLDRTDSLLVSFGLGHRPGGNKDPLGQRRWILAILRILQEAPIRLDLASFFETCYLHIRHDLPVLKPWEDIKEVLFENVRSRLTTYWLEKGYKEAWVRAVIDVEPFDPFDLKCRLDALKALPEEKLYRVGLVHKRLFQMTKNFNAVVNPNADLFENEYEYELWERIDALKESFDELYKKQEYESILVELAELSPIIHTFFENVFVMAEDEAIRINRLSLLTQARELFDRFGHFERWAIEVTEVV